MEASTLRELHASWVDSRAKLRVKVTQQKSHWLPQMPLSALGLQLRLGPNMSLT